MSPGMAAAELKRQNKLDILVHFANRNNDETKNKKSAATLHCDCRARNRARIVTVDRNIMLFAI